MVSFTTELFIYLCTHLPGAMDKHNNKQWTLKSMFRLVDVNWTVEICFYDGVCCFSTASFRSIEQRNSFLIFTGCFPFGYYSNQFILLLWIFFLNFLSSKNLFFFYSNRKRCIKKWFHWIFVLVDRARVSKPVITILWDEGT